MLWGVAAVCLTEHEWVPVLVFVYSLVFSLDPIDTFDDFNR